jgi:acetylornithine deacetylase/succinyl-diaminopimelate desuccinylase-like protein
VVLGVIATLALVLVVRAARMSSRQITAPPANVLAPLHGAAERLGGALKWQTVSVEPMDPSQLTGLREHIERSFPRAHEALTRESFDHALLYTWKGTMLAKEPQSNALVRTTTAATMLEGSVKDNVLPARARAVINFRILPGDTVAAVVDHVKQAVNDARVLVRAIDATKGEPSPVSSIEAEGYRALVTTIRQVFPAALVAPSLVLGATDARHFARFARGTYRFVPWTLEAGDLKRIHGKDERMSVASYERGIGFHALLLQSL